MSRKFFVSLLPLSLLVSQQLADPNAAHIKEWTERHAQYLSEPKLTETDFRLEIAANDPRPLENVLYMLARQNGWHINYEDPRYGKSDILDDTAPSWLKDHPNGPRAYVIAGGSFYAKISVDGHFPDDPMQVLPSLVEAYNRSDNPGRFELRQTNHGEFDVVPTAAADGPQKPILDTPMSFNAFDSDVTHSVEVFCEAESCEWRVR